MKQSLLTKKTNIRLENKRSSNQKLIYSAIKNISERGIGETTMLNVSQGAGLSQGIVNFHFKSKELLLIETLKYISNEYLDSFQQSIKRAGNDPRKKIITIIKNDFSRNICNRDKISVWFTFFSEVKFKPVYLQICKERDDYYIRIVKEIFEELIKNEKNIKLSSKQLTTSLLALSMGLWLDQLADPETFKRKDAVDICINFVKSNFKKQFRDY